MTNIVPQYTDILWPTLKVLEDIGGSASIQELSDKVAMFMDLSDEVLEVPHTKGSRSCFEYRSAWARTHLKYIGAVENSSRAVWSITEIGKNVKNEKIVRSLVESYRQQQRKIRQQNRTTDVDPSDELGVEVDDEQSWEDKLLYLLKSMKPDAFERLCRRILLESGFTKVEVTGRSGDGGIDGVGILRVNLLSFHVVFQCKKYEDAVSSSAIRDFRGAMVGRADKGLFITTGRYTREAEKEAVRDGAPAIDLIDGEELCILLKNLKLGVDVEVIEEVKINSAFFAAM